MLTERYCHSNFHYAAAFWHHNDTAFILWYSPSLGSGQFICISGSCISYHEFTRVPESDWKCKHWRWEHIILIYRKLVFYIYRAVNVFDVVTRLTELFNGKYLLLSGSPKIHSAKLFMDQSVMKYLPHLG